MFLFCFLRRILADRSTAGVLNRLPF